MPVKYAVVMITGGAIRVGRQVALHLAGLGAHLSFSYLPGEPGPAKIQAALKATDLAGRGQQLLQGGGVMGDFAQAQVCGLSSEVVEGIVQAVAGIRVVVDQFQVLQAFLGLGQQHLGIQQEAL